MLAGGCLVGIFLFAGYLLQTIATWRRGDPRRGTVLRLDVASEVAPDWAAAAEGLAVLI